MPNVGRALVAAGTVSPMFLRQPDPETLVIPASLKLLHINPLAPQHGLRCRYPPGTRLPVLG